MSLYAGPRARSPAGRRIRDGGHRRFCRLPRLRGPISIPRGRRWFPPTDPHGDRRLQLSGSGIRSRPFRYARDPGKDNGSDPTASLVESKDNGLFPAWAWAFLCRWSLLGRVSTGPLIIISIPPSALSLCLARVHVLAGVRGPVTCGVGGGGGGQGVSTCGQSGESFPIKEESESSPDDPPACAL